MRRHQLAIHESGHVVAALALGVPFRSVSLAGRGFVTLNCSRLTPTPACAASILVTCLAGGLAEELHFGRGGYSAEDLNGVNLTADFLARHVGFDADEWIHRGRREALRMLRWPGSKKAGLALSMALLDRGELDASEARGIALAVQTPAPALYAPSWF